MFEKVGRFFERLGRPLVARFPNLYLMKLYVFFPLVLMATLVGGAVAKWTPIGMERRAIAEGPLVGLMGVMFGYLVLGVFQGRDHHRYLPERGWKAFALALLSAVCVLGMTAPILAFAGIRTMKSIELRHSSELQGLMASQLLLEAEYRKVRESPEPAPGVDAAAEAYLDHLRQFGRLARVTPECRVAPGSASGKLVDLPSTSECFGKLGFSLRVFFAEERWDEEKWSLAEMSQHGDENDRRAFRQVALAALVVALTAFLLQTAALEASSPQAFLTGTTSILLVVLGVWLTSIPSLSIISQAAVVEVLALLCAFSAAVQWWRRDAGRLARATAVALAFLGPCIVPAFIAMLAPQDPPIHLSLLAMGWVGYFALFPLIHGNLTRLRYLPQL